MLNAHLCAPKQVSKIVTYMKLYSKGFHTLFSFYPPSHITYPKSNAQYINKNLNFIMEI